MMSHQQCICSLFSLSYLQIEIARYDRWMRDGRMLHFVSCCCYPDMTFSMSLHRSTSTAPRLWSSLAAPSTCERPSLAAPSSITLSLILSCNYRSSICPVSSRFSSSLWPLSLPWRTLKTTTLWHSLLTERPTSTRSRVPLRRCTRWKWSRSTHLCGQSSISPSSLSLPLSLIEVCCSLYHNIVFAFLFLLPEVWLYLLHILSVEEWYLVPHSLWLLLLFAFFVCVMPHIFH